MKIVNEALLDMFREKRRCEWCGKPQSGCDPHHVFASGIGGGRIDLAINLVALCRLCHTLVHNGEVARFDLLAVVAAREGMNQDAIERELYRVRRLPKGSKYP